MARLVTKFKYLKTEYIFVDAKAPNRPLVDKK